MFFVCVADCPLIPYNNMRVSVSVGSNLSLTQRQHSIRVWAHHLKLLWDMRFFSRCFVLAVTLCSAYTARAQTAVEIILERLNVLIFEDFGEYFVLSDLYDRLYYYQQHPIYLNRTDRRELRGLQFVPQLFIDN